MVRISLNLKRCLVQSSTILAIISMISVGLAPLQSSASTGHYINYYCSRFQNGKLSFYPVYKNYTKHISHHTYVPRRAYIYYPRHTKVHKTYVYRPVVHHVIHNYNPSGNTLSHHDLTKLFNLANANLGKPYSWGGNGPYSYDCSGFTQYLYRNALHKNIPRNAQIQYDESVHIAPNQRRAGDLVFFGSGVNNISHVGLYSGKNAQGNDQMYDAQLNGVKHENIYEPWWNYLVGYGVPNVVSQQYNR